MLITNVMKRGMYFKPDGPGRNDPPSLGEDGPDGPEILSTYPGPSSAWLIIKSNYAIAAVNYASAAADCNKVADILDAMGLDELAAIYRQAAVVYQGKADWCEHMKNDPPQADYKRKVALPEPYRDIEGVETDALGSMREAVKRLQRSVEEHELAVEACERAQGAEAAGDLPWTRRHALAMAQLEQSARAHSTQAEILIDRARRQVEMP